MTLERVESDADQADTGVNLLSLRSDKNLKIVGLKIERYRMEIFSSVCSYAPIYRQTMLAVDQFLFRFQIPCYVELTFEHKIEKYDPHSNYPVVKHVLFFRIPEAPEFG